jgi:phage terminase small subunit
MTQRGRKSPTFRVDGRPPRIPPPDALPEPERRIWAGLVGQCPPEHFVGSDEPLLTAYCAAIAEHAVATEALRREGAVLPGGVLNPWGRVLERAIKSMAMLSMRLRLSPQSRREKAKAERPLSAYEDPNGSWQDELRPWEDTA